MKGNNLQRDAQQMGCKELFQIRGGEKLSACSIDPLMFQHARDLEKKQIRIEEHLLL